MDHLEAAVRAAINLLLQLPDNEAEMSIANLAHDAWLGMGYLVGIGWAVYCGDHCYRFKDAYRRHLAKKYLADAHTDDLFAITTSG